MTAEADKPSVEGLMDDLEYAVLARSQGHGSNARIKECRERLACAAAPAAQPEWQVIWTALDETAKQIHDEAARNNVREFLARAWHHQVVPALAANRAPAAQPATPLREVPCWLVEKRSEGRTVGYLGHALGTYDWMPTPDQATRFVRREDANGVAECFEFEGVIVAEHIWG